MYWPFWTTTTSMKMLMLASDTIFDVVVGLCAATAPFHQSSTGHIVQ